MNQRVAKCLVVSNVLVADGLMTDDERSFLDAMMQRHNLTDEERRTVIELDGMDKAEGVASRLSLQERQELVEELVDAASADGRLSPHEHATIKKITKALGLA